MVCGNFIIFEPSKKIKRNIWGAETAETQRKEVMREVFDV